MLTPHEEKDAELQWIFLPTDAGVHSDGELRSENDAVLFAPPRR